MWSAGEVAQVWEMKGTHPTLKSLGHWEMYVASYACGRKRTKGKADLNGSGCYETPKGLGEKTQNCGDASSLIQSSLSELSSSTGSYSIADLRHLHKSY